MRSLMFKTIFILLALASLAHAQGPQATWVQSSVQSATQAQGFTYKLYVTPAGSSTANSPVTLSSVLCGGTAPTVSCSAPLPSSSPALVTGARSSLTATDSGGIESAQSVPFTKPAVAPTSLSITP